MDIDIIDLTSPEYSSLSNIQLAMVRAAQAKKNEIEARAEEEKGKYFRKFLSNQVARSSMCRQIVAEIDAKTQTQVEVVREDLRHQLNYEELFSEGNEYGPYRYPENPNYNLTYPERFIVVRNFYMHLTTNPEARLEAFSMDSLARTYLGEHYQSLYELLASYC